MADPTDLENLVEDADYSMGHSAERARMENQLLLEELERKKRARALAVPTDDLRVKLRLRELGEPITLFGERAADRRDRLKSILSKNEVVLGSVEDEEQSSSDEEQAEEFYTHGTLELLDARRKLSDFSLPRALERIKRQRIEAQIPLGRIVDARKSVFAQLKGYTSVGSQVADERPISQVRFSPDSKLLATGSWSGTVKIWNVPVCTIALTLRGHTDRVGGLAWHPKSTCGQSDHAVNLASSGADGLVYLWSLASEQPMSTLTGHQDRVCRVAFHPCGAYLASASYDGTWRLWDVESAAEILNQEGHSKELYAIAFQDDGSLVASGGLDAIGRVWDLRTGRTAMVLDGHVQGIYGIDFSPNGYEIATGSGDDTIRIWDMRSLKSLHTIPAHKSTVSDVRFFKGVSDSVAEAPAADGLYLASSGYDGFVKLWSADDWQLLRSLPINAGKVMSVDLSADGRHMAAGSWNRSFHLYGQAAETS